MALTLVLLAGTPFSFGRAEVVSANPSRHAWTIPGTLRIALNGGDPNALNPIVTTRSTENFLANLVFDGLVDSFPDGTIVPKLAAVVPTRANGGLSADGKTIIYKLRHGVHWHDGADFTSADVAFTLRA